MSGFAPSCCTAPCRTALRAAPALLLAIASGHALAQAPLAAFPDAFGHSRAYTPAERISANLLAGGMSRLAAIRSDEHTSELQSLMRTSYAAFCLKKKKTRERTVTEVASDLISLPSFTTSS